MHPFKLLTAQGVAVVSQAELQKPFLPTDCGPCCYAGLLAFTNKHENGPGWKQLHVVSNVEKIHSIHDDSHVTAPKHQPLSNTDPLAQASTGHCCVPFESANPQHHMPSAGCQHISGVDKGPVA
jgi:hypothetical protein